METMGNPERFRNADYAFRIGMIHFGHRNVYDCKLLRYIAGNDEEDRICPMHESNMTDRWNRTSRASNTID